MHGRLHRGVALTGRSSLPELDQFHRLLQSGFPHQCVVALAERWCHVPAMMHELLAFGLRLSAAGREDTDWWRTVKMLGPYMLRDS
jgi:hypothetical protein